MYRYRSYVVRSGFRFPTEWHRSGPKILIRTGVMIKRLFLITRNNAFVHCVVACIPENPYSYGSNQLIGSVLMSFFLDFAPLQNGTGPVKKYWLEPELWLKNRVFEISRFSQAIRLAFFRISISRIFYLLFLCPETLFSYRVLHSEHEYQSEISPLWLELELWLNYFFNFPMLFPIGFFFCFFFIFVRPETLFSTYIRSNMHEIRLSWSFGVVSKKSRFQCFSKSIDLPFFEYRLVEFFIYYFFVLKLCFLIEFCILNTNIKAKFRHFD